MQKLTLATILIAVFSIAIASYEIPQALALSDNIAFTSPTINQVILDSSVTFAGTFTESSTAVIQIEVDAYPNVWINVSPDSANTWAVSLSLPDGQHTAEIWMQDASGNYTDQVTFDVVTTAQAQTKYNMILPLLSQTCQTLLKHHIKSECPTLNQLAPFDTSNGIKTGSGSWIKDSNGTITGRSKPQLTNYWNFFTNSKNKVVCVECDFDFNRLDTVQVIFIEPHDFQYVSPTPILNATTSYQYWNGTAYLTRYETDISQTSSWTVNFHRFVTPDCMTANEPYSPSLLADTIYYLNSGCTKTNIVTNATIAQIQPVVDIAHSRQYIDSQWEEKQLVNNKGNCITHKCAPTKDPNSNW